jgi:bifunctional non-homologous end joining protein LigD
MLFRLDGQKLQGQWTLVRMRPREERDEKAWLLIKTEENAKPISARAEDRSVLTGRTMKQIASQQDRVWESNRDAPSGRAKASERPARRRRGQPLH